MPKSPAFVVFSHFTALQIHSSLSAEPRQVKSKSPSPLGKRASLEPARIRKASTKSVSAREIREACQLVSNICGMPLGNAVHIITAAQSQHRNVEFANLHLCTVDLPAGSVFKLARNVFVCSPELALLQIAASGISRIALLELAYETCGTYRRALCDGGAVFNVAPFCAKERIGAFARKHPSLRGSKIISKLLPYLANESASPQETKLALLFCLPLRFGGYGFKTPVMNYVVPSSDHAYAIAKRAFFRCDICWPEWKIDLEYQSAFAHAGEPARIRDSRRTNALASMGWTTIGVTGDEIESASACDAIAKAIRTAMGKRQNRLPSSYALRQQELRWELGLSC